MQQNTAKARKESQSFQFVVGCAMHFPLVKETPLRSLFAPKNGFLFFSLLCCGSNEQVN
jgi:hypothetical protein